MGKARDGRISKNFGDKKNPVKARFNSENQAMRVAVLFEWVRYALGDGAQPDDIKAMLESDFDKATEILDKIQAQQAQIGEKHGTN